MVIHHLSLDETWTITIHSFIHSGHWKVLTFLILSPRVALLLDFFCTAGGVNSSSSSLKGVKSKASSSSRIDFFEGGVDPLAVSKLDADMFFVSTAHRPREIPRAADDDRILVYIYYYYFFYISFPVLDSTEMEEGGVKIYRSTNDHSRLRTFGLTYESIEIVVENICGYQIIRKLPKKNIYYIFSESTCWREGLRRVNDRLPPSPPSPSITTNPKLFQG